MKNSFRLLVSPLLKLIREYKGTLIIASIIIYLSFFTPPKTELDNVSNIDKIAHICMYFCLCLFIWGEYLYSHTYINILHTIIGAITLPILFSAIIELLQEYATTNRSGDWEDLIANTIGILLAAIFTHLFMKHWNWIRKGRNKDSA